MTARERAVKVISICVVGIENPSIASESLMKILDVYCGIYDLPEEIHECISKTRKQ